MWKKPRTGNNIAVWFRNSWVTIAEEPKNRDKYCSMVQELRLKLWQKPTTGINIALWLRNLG